jgi:hypothetical protein
MSASDVGGPQGFLDFFPGYVPYGLREIAVATDAIELLRWVALVSPPAFDVLASTNRDRFVGFAAMLIEGDLSSALRKAEDLLTSHPHDHNPEMVAAEQALAGLLRLVARLAASRSNPQSLEADDWQQLFVRVGAGAQTLVGIHEGAESG